MKIIHFQMSIVNKMIQIMGKRVMRIKWLNVKWLGIVVKKSLLKLCLLV
ncbi:unnamed protein product [Trichobilharzia regenti]|nr:unnamed protein product [Trichobilharzia regenti]